MSNDKTKVCVTLALEEPEQGGAPISSDAAYNIKLAKESSIALIAELDKLNKDNNNLIKGKVVAEKNGEKYDPFLGNFALSAWNSSGSCNPKDSDVLIPNYGAISSQDTSNQLRNLDTYINQALYSNSQPQNSDHFPRINVFI